MNNQTDSPDLRIEFKFKNAVLWNALVDRFTSTARALRERAQGPDPIIAVAATAIGVTRTNIGQLLNLREQPRFRNRDRGFRPVAVKIAEYLDIDCQALFPESLYAIRFPRTPYLEVYSESFISLGAAKGEYYLPSYEQSVDPGPALTKALDTIPPRLRGLISSRYGIDGQEPKSMRELAKEMGVSRSRVDQLESMALRMLRHPSRAFPLREALMA